MPPPETAKEQSWVKEEAVGSGQKLQGQTQVVSDYTDNTLEPGRVQTPSEIIAKLKQGWSKPAFQRNDTKRDLVNENRHK